MAGYYVGSHRFVLRSDAFRYAKSQAVILRTFVSIKGFDGRGFVLGTWTACPEGTITDENSPKSWDALDCIGGMA